VSGWVGGCAWVCGCGCACVCVWCVCVCVCVGLVDGAVDCHGVGQGGLSRHAVEGRAIKFHLFFH
jgi:hypothetical protein